MGRGVDKVVTPAAQAAPTPDQTPIIADGRPPGPRVGIGLPIYGFFVGDGGRVSTPLPSRLTRDMGDPSSFDPLS
jgi:hypothetical protein